MAIILLFFSPFLFFSFHISFLSYLIIHSSFSHKILGFSLKNNTMNILAIVCRIRRVSNHTFVSLEIYSMILFFCSSHIFFQTYFSFNTVLQVAKKTCNILNWHYLRHLKISDLVPRFPLEDLTKRNSAVRTKKKTSLFFSVK